MGTAFLVYRGGVNMCVCMCKDGRGREEEKRYQQSVVCESSRMHTYMCSKYECKLQRWVN